MTEQLDPTLQPVLDLLNQQFARQEISEEQYRGRLQALGVEPPATFQQSGQQVNEQKNAARDYVDHSRHVTRLYNVYQTAPGKPRLSEADFRKVLDDYLDWVKREYGYSRLHGLQNLQNTGALSKPLTQVYTSLVARSRPAVESGGQRVKSRRQSQGGITPEWLEREAESQPIDMADLLTLGERIAVVGSAGSGKTTYLSFVAVSLAAALRGETLDARLKPPAPERPLPVPLIAPLRFWKVYRDECAQVPGLRITHAPDHGSLGAFLLWFLRARYKNFDAAGDFFERLLKGGHGALILLDGLDEVVNVAERRVVRDEVERLLRVQYPGNRCLVTAREAGYRDAPFGDDFVRCDVQPLTAEQIGALVTAWCEQIYPQATDRDAAGSDLQQAIERLNRERSERGQAPLVATPLMVTMVVSVKYSRRELPRERAKLYDACVDVILNSEYTGREDEAGARQTVVSLGGPPDKQREWLSVLAFRMHQGGQAGATLDEDALKAILLPVFAERGEGARLPAFIDTIRHRGNLLEERGERFQFLHLTFQEYLAAQFLARQWTEQSADFLARIAVDEWWREAVLLTAGSLGAPAPYERRRALLARLCDVNDSPDAQLAAAELAATGLLDLSEPEPALTELVQNRLLSLLTSPALSQTRPALRALAGNALAVLGDPRDFDELIKIPAGLFMMGSDTITDDEKPSHSINLPPFKIGKYPVTNLQYRCFEKTWTYPLERANHPVVNVTWHQARAYCQWLTGEWRSTGRIRRDEEVRLPTEAEWEKAARGTDGREYPWGNEWATNKCNTSESAFDMTTMVGLFPDGASPYGCLDMAGNVWEWTSSLYRKGEVLEFKYPYTSKDGRENLESDDTLTRVLRGGAFPYGSYYARCAYRGKYGPYDSWNYYGIRVAVSAV